MDHNRSLFGLISTLRCFMNTGPDYTSRSPSSYLALLRCMLSSLLADASPSQSVHHLKSRFVQDIQRLLCQRTHSLSAEHNRFICRDRCYIEWFTSVILLIGNDAGEHVWLIKTRFPRCREGRENRWHTAKAHSLLSIPTSSRSAVVDKKILDLRTGINTRTTDRARKGSDTPQFGNSR